MPSPALSIYLMLFIFRTICLFPSAIRLFNFSRRALLSSPGTMRPSSVTTDTPSTSRFVIFKPTFLSSSSGSSPAATNPGTARRINNDAHWICQFGDLVKRTSRIAIVIQDLGQLESRKILQRVRHARHSIVEVTLSRNRDDRNIPFTGNERRHSLQALSARLEVVRSDVQHALRIRHIRIHANHRDALCHRLVNLGLENLGPRRGEADSGGLLFHDPAKHSHLCVGGVRRLNDEFTLYAERSGRVQKSRLRLLPVRQVNIRGHEHVAFVFLVVGFRTSRNLRRPSENRNSYQRGPMSPHWNSPSHSVWPEGAFARTLEKFGLWHTLCWGNFERTGGLPPLPRPLRFRLPLVRNFRFQLYFYGETIGRSRKEAMRFFRAWLARILLRLDASLVLSLLT